MRIFVAPGLQAHQFQLLGDDLGALCGGHTAEFQPQAHVFAHRAPGQQRKLLEHHGHAGGAQAAQGGGVAAGQVHGLAVALAHQHRAPVGLIQAVEAA